MVPREVPDGHPSTHPFSYLLYSMLQLTKKLPCTPFGVVQYLTGRLMVMMRRRAITPFEVDARVVRREDEEEKSREAHTL